MDEDNNIELKPCPFCGYMPQVYSYDYKLPSGKVYARQWAVECSYHECQAQPSVDWHYTTRKEAVEAWNRRA
jgi:Lar family restriction alleviation protein